jgi:spore maturation protein CgeB
MAPADVFNPYQHLMLYENDALLCSAVNMFLRNPGIAQKQGDAGRAEVLAHHTYAHRAAQMLAAL